MVIYKRGTNYHELECAFYSTIAHGGRADIKNPKSTNQTCILLAVQKDWTVILCPNLLNSWVQATELTLCFCTMWHPVKSNRWIAPLSWTKMLFIPKQQETLFKGELK